MKFRSLIVLLSCSLCLVAEAENLEKVEEKVAEKEQQVEIAKVSEAKVSESFGHLIGKNINTMNLDFDIASVMKGVQDSLDGKESPMSEEDCIQAITAAQEEARQKLADDNLAKAEEFLKSNAKIKGIVSIEEGKLQYKIDKKGTGEVVQSTSTPSILYSATYLDGSSFASSEENETPICLDETIQGFKKGLVGMKEGEKRTLYIHPEYAYGTQGFLPPNALLTFEVEIVKAHAPPQETAEEMAAEQASPATEEEQSAELR
ncbi:MAG: putative FKBP-type peptidyl-prolyl cis-trans isomerase FkpA [Chlamydiae bacterium]|nr:putative FKBP-type peptidyl-prolyl cis-trans isomerase FkpA [Chlamydiota bacterium]